MTTIMGEKLGKRLRRLRKSKGLGLRETAIKVGISPAYLSRVETSAEKSPPAEKVIRSLAELLEDDFDTLMCLAGRVSADVEAIIKADPRLPQFLRQAKERKLSGEDLLTSIQAQRVPSSYILEYLAKHGSACGCMQVEVEAFHTLNALAQRYGYGRLPQLADELRRIWYSYMDAKKVGP